jgi:hypothetical protein
VTQKEKAKKKNKIGCFRNLNPVTPGLSRVRDYFILKEE